MADIYDNLPIPDYFDELAHSFLQAYVLYRTVSPNEPDSTGLFTWRELGYTHKFREGVCTHCGEWFAADRDSVGEYAQFWNAKHNQNGRCPACGRTVTCKARGRLQSFSTLDTRIRLLFVQVLSQERVWLRGCIIDAVYGNSTTQPDLEFHEVVRYELTPGKARCIKRGFSNMFGVFGHWQEINRITEPWAVSYMRNRMWYELAGEHLLNNTFLKYFPVDTFYNREYPVDSSDYYMGYSDRVPWGRILSYAAVFPSLEMAAKLDCWEFINDLVGRNRKNLQYINWKARSVDQFLRMPKADAKKLIQGVNINRLKLYRLLKSADKVLEYDGFEADGLTALDVHSDGTEKLLKYLKKQGYRSNGYSVLRDYWRDAAALGRDLTVDRIRFPRNLSQAHDEYYRAAAALREEKKAVVKASVRKRYCDTYKNYRRLFEWCDGEYVAMVPELLSDIKLEGENMHHCVGGYIDRHAEGKTVIIFIRKEIYPMISLYTAEISPGGELRQVQGYHNETKNKPTPEAQRFIDRWLDEVGRRLKKAGKQKSGEKETA